MTHSFLEWFKYFKSDGTFVTAGASRANKGLEINLFSRYQSIKKKCLKELRTFIVHVGLGTCGGMGRRNLVKPEDDC